MEQSKRRVLIIMAILLALAIILGIVWIIRAATTYTYDTEELNAICEEYSLHTHLLGQKLTTSISSRKFYKFTAGETTQRQVLKAVGDPHTTNGSGFVYFVYFTSDRHLVFVLYDSDDVVEYICITNLQTGTSTKITL